MHHYGKVNLEGKLILENRELMLTDIARHTGKPVVLIIEKDNEKRSNQQNKYYWSVIINFITEAVNQLGNEWDAYETHEFLKALFLKKPTMIMDSESGELIADGYRVESTSKLDKAEFNEYIENCIRWAAENLDIEIPYPNEKNEKTAEM